MSAVSMRIQMAMLYRIGYVRYVELLRPIVGGRSSTTYACYTHRYSVMKRRCIQVRPLVTNMSGFAGARITLSSLILF